MNRCVIAATLLTGVAPIAPAIALDAACDPIIKAAEQKMQQPAWYTVSEFKSGKLEAMKVDGHYFAHIGDGKWQPGPNLDQAAKVMLDMMRNGTATVTDCKNAGSETLDGNVTTIITYTATLPGLPAPTQVKLNIGQADGLPYRESSQKGQTTIITRYKDIIAPKL